MQDIFVGAFGWLFVGQTDKVNLWQFSWTFFAARKMSKNVQTFLYEAKQA